MIRIKRNLQVFGWITCICLLVGCASSQERVRAAIDTGNIDEVRRSLDSSVDSGWALFYAVRNNVQNKQLHIARHLLSTGANPNEHRESWLVDDLVVIDPLSKEKVPLTLLYPQRIAVDLDADKKQQLLSDIKKGRYHYTYKLKKAAGETPMDVAINNNDSEMVKLLLELGADYTELHVVDNALPFDPDDPAIRRNRYFHFYSQEFIIASFLNGASINNQGGIILLRKGDYAYSNLLPVQGKLDTSLEYARSRGNPSIVQLLESAAKLKGRIQK